MTSDCMCYGFLYISLSANNIFTTLVLNYINSSVLKTDTNISSGSCSIVEISNVFHINFSVGGFSWLLIETTMSFQASFSYLNDDKVATTYKVLFTLTWIHKQDKNGDNLREMLKRNFSTAYEHIYPVKQVERSIAL